MDHEAIGITCALLAALAWSLAMIFFKKSGENVPPLALNLFKNVIAVVLLTITLAFVSDGWSQIWSYSAGDIWILLISGIIGIAVADTLFFYSLNLIGVGIVSIVDCLYSPFIILFSFLLLAEELSPLQYLGAALVLAAVYITSGHAPPADRTKRQLLAGILIGVVNMAFMGFGIVIAKPVLNHSDVTVATLIRMVGGTAVLLVVILALPRRRALLAAFRPSRSWRMSIPGAVLGAYLACILWIAGFKYSRASVAAILNQTTTIFALILAALILKEKFTRRKFVAVIIATIGILLVAFYE